MKLLFECVYPLAKPYFVLIHNLRDSLLFWDQGNVSPYFYPPRLHTSKAYNKKIDDQCKWIQN